MRPLSRYLGLVSLLSLAGCESTGVGNPGPQTIELALAVDDSPEPEAADPDQTLPVGSLERALLVLGSLRWVPCDSNQPAVVDEGPFVVDLVAGNVAPAFAPVEVPAGGFCGLDAPLQPLEEPASLAGRSLIVVGQRTDGIRFLIFASPEATLHLETRDGAWTGTQNPYVIWAVRPRRWLAPSELDGVDPVTLVDGSQVVAIDADRHPLLFAALLSRLAGRSSLYDDANGNGRLDGTERSDAAWLGSGLDTVD
jgi:hypothetical protein